LIISIIAATTLNNVIGINNRMPWHLPKEMRYFMRTTMGHTIILGRKNYESIGSKPLPKRTNIVITRNRDLKLEGAIVTHSIAEALGTALIRKEKEAFIIGGGEIYKQSLPFADRLYLTRIHTELEGDIFFPTFDETEWEIIEKVSYQADEKNLYDFDTFVMKRIKAVEK